jgi:tight adherence protein C
MSWMAWPTLLSVLASALAGAALLELARLPVRRQGGRRGAAAGRASDSAPRARWSAARGRDATIERLLDAAGRVEVPDAAALAARRRVGAVVGGAWAGAAAWLALPPPLVVVVVAAGASGGRWLPLAMVRRAGRARGLRLRDETPELLELLAVAFGCGLPVRAAFEAAGRWSVGELSAGVRRAAAELARGAAVGPTLARLVREHPTAELDAAIAILERSRVRGTPAAEPLRALATSARHARARRAMEHAARAAPRVQLVAALLLVPAALCVLAASLVAGGFG